MATIDHVFVYGTLLRGLSAAGFLEHLEAEFVGEGRVRGRLYVTDFPRLATTSEADELVQGEVYRLLQSAPALAALDQFEREGDLYTRVVLEVVLESGPTVAAWSYVSRTALPEDARVASGSYRSYLRERGPAD